MSLSLVRWAHKQDAGSVANKAVLVALAAAKLDEHGRRAVPLADLVAATEASAATVKRALAALADRKLIERVRQVDDYGADLATSYTLKPPKRGAHSEPPPGAQSEPPRGAHSEPGEGLTVSQGGGSPRATPQCFKEDLLRKSSITTAASQPRAREKRAVEVAKTARLVATQKIINAWRDSHGDRPYTEDGYRRITDKVDEMLRDGRAPDVVARALRLWDTKDASPGLLPYLYDQALKADRPAAPAAVGPVLSTADKRVAAAQALKAQLLAEEHGGGTVIRLPGAAS